jgi:hypothetical protein
MDSAGDARPFEDEVGPGARDLMEFDGRAIGGRIDCFRAATLGRAEEDMCADIRDCFSLCCVLVLMLSGSKALIVRLSCMIYT